MVEKYSTVGGTVLYQREGPWGCHEKLKAVTAELNNPAHRTDCEWQVD